MTATAPAQGLMTLQLLGCALNPINSSIIATALIFIGRDCGGGSRRSGRAAARRITLAGWCRQAYAYTN
jgi:hypothetical protein